MSRGSLNLDALIAPLSSEAFFARYWEQKPYVVNRKDPRFYASLLTRENLEHLITDSDLRYPALELAKDGAYLPPEAFTLTLKHGSESFSGVPDLAKVQSEYCNGASLVLPALQRTWPALLALCAALDDQLDHPSHANAYLTPGNATGFTPHYDTHEVFVLQIAGTKHWRVFHPPLTLPHRSQPFNPARYLPPAVPSFEFDLEPGDLLYLPRGYVHTAATTAVHSAHVTIGISVFTWQDLLLELLSAGKQQESFRAALPPGFSSRPELAVPLQEGFAHRVKSLVESSDYARLVAGFTQRVRPARSVVREPFRLDVNVIDLDTVVTVPGRHRYSISHSRDKARLQFDGRSLDLPRGAGLLLDAMGQKKHFRTSDLPPHFDRLSALRLVRHLVDQGFLTIVSDPI